MEPYDIKDTTGAGDCFTGAFATEYIRQCKLFGLWEKDDDDKKEEKGKDKDNDKDKDKKRLECIGNAIKFGCVAAGLSVQKKGTIASIPCLRDVVVASLQEKI